MIEKNRLFTIAYWPPVSQFMAMTEASFITFEAAEHFQKQSYRNRMNILSANGVLPLSIPILKDSHKIPIKEAKIDYKTNWQQIHWRSIEAAYNASPYFLYYKDLFVEFYSTSHYKWLFDFDMELMARLFKILGLSLKIEITEEYQTEVDKNCDDLRLAFHPKKRSSQMVKPYSQVFEQKFGFIEDLSIIDLLCNAGPESKKFL